jgi:hypothetical protein
VEQAQRTTLSGTNSGLTNTGFSFVQSDSATDSNTITGLVGPSNPAVTEQTGNGQTMLQVTVVRGGINLPEGLQANNPIEPVNGALDGNRQSGESEELRTDPQSR